MGTSTTRWGHSQNVVVQVLGHTIPSLLGGNNPDPVHRQCFQAFDSEGGQEDGGDITTGPFKALSLTDFYIIAFGIILDPLLLSWFSP